MGYLNPIPGHESDLTWMRNRMSRIKQLFVRAVFFSSSSRPLAHDPGKLSASRSTSEIVGLAKVFFCNVVLTSSISTNIAES